MYVCSGAESVITRLSSDCSCQTLIYKSPVTTLSPSCVIHSQLHVKMNILLLQCQALIVSTYYYFTSSRYASLVIWQKKRKICDNLIGLGSLWKKSIKYFLYFYNILASFKENKHIRADLAGFYELWKLTCSEEIKLTSLRPCIANLCADINCD